MTTNEPDDKLEELARRGMEMYANRVKPRLGPEHDGMFVAIDIDSGDYEIDEHDVLAVDHLRMRLPDNAEVWLERVGQDTAYTMGFGCTIFDYDLPPQSGRP